MAVKRLFDLVLASVAGLVLAVPMLLVFIAVRLTSPGPALYWSDRVGRNNKIFKMPKFCSLAGSSSLRCRVFSGTPITAPSGASN